MKCIRGFEILSIFHNKVNPYTIRTSNEYIATQADTDVSTNYIRNLFLTSVKAVYGAIYHCINLSQRSNEYCLRTQTVNSTAAEQKIIEEVGWTWNEVERHKWILFYI